MPTPIERLVTAPDIFGAVIAGFVFIALASLLKEPTRQRFNAIFVAGAGAAYLSSGLGIYEFAYTAVATIVAYRGLRSYAFIGAAWMMHVAWDVVHHLYGDPIVPWVEASSAGCAVCDTIMALWFFAGAPSPWPHVRRSDASRLIRQAGASDLAT